MIHRDFGLYGLLLLAVVLLLPAAAFAQTTIPGESVSISNGYIGATVYLSGDDDSGHFEIWNVAGDPASTADDHQPLIGSGGVQLLVDTIGGDGEDAALTWATFAKGGNLGLWGDIEEDGMWIAPPEILPGEQCIRGVWVPIAEEDLSPLVECEQEVRIFHDMVRFKWTLTNRDLFEHQIGLKVYGDLITEPENGGTLDQDNVVSVPGFPLIDQRTLFPGTFQPVYTDTRLCPYLEVFNSQGEPGRGARVIFDGLDATRPNVIGIDEYGVLSSTLWSYVNDLNNTAPRLKTVWGYEIYPEGQLIASNLGYAAFWKPVSVPAGQKRTIIHYVANPASSHSLNIPSIALPKYAAALSGPKALKYYMDPATGVESFGPSTFTVTASLENQDRYTDLANCSFTLILPTGLALDSTELVNGNLQYNKTIARIAPNTDGSVSWRVKADGRRTGVLSYQVSVNASPMGGTIVRRDIHIPAIGEQSFSYGWQQVAVPFQLQNTNPVTALSLDAGCLVRTSKGIYPIMRYDPINIPTTAAGWPYEEVQSVVPGEAYYMWLNNAGTTNMAQGNYSAMQFDGTGGQPIALTTGWNMIGNPYVYTVTAGEVRFYTEHRGTITYDEAVRDRMVSRTIYWWNTSFATWNWSTQRSVPLKPWQGYWIKVLDPRVKSVIITPASQIGAAVGGAPPPAGDDDDGPIGPPG